MQRTKDAAVSLTWDNALLYCSLGGVEGVCHTVFLLPYFYLAAAPNLEDSHTATQLGQALLQLFSAISAAPVRSRLNHILTQGARMVAFGTSLTKEQHTWRDACIFKLRLLRFV